MIQTKKHLLFHVFSDEDALRLRLRLPSQHVSTASVRSVTEMLKDEKLFHLRSDESQPFGLSVSLYGTDICELLKKHL